MILATPNRMHVDGGLECVAAGVPVIVEKPVGDTVEGATRLVEAGEAAGVPVLTGHHRNYSRSWRRRGRSCAAGGSGAIVAVTGTALFHKPDDYFDVGDGWRRQPGGGPILLNLIHEVNNLLSLVGRDRAGAGGDVERDARLPRGGHRGDGVHLRQRCAGHVPALRHGGARPGRGSRPRGENTELRQVRRRGLLPHRRHVGVAVRAHDAAAHLPRRRGRGGSPSPRRPSRSSTAIRSRTRSPTSPT